MNKTNIFQKNSFEELRSFVGRSFFITELGKKILFTNSID